jgi:ferrochelatase
LAIIDNPENHPSFPEKSKIGVLLVNLGTPEGTDYWSMRKYLKQFFSSIEHITLNLINK